MDQSFGIVGNGRVLAKVLADGTVTELFFPSVGFYRHILQSQFGLVDRAGNVRWLGDKRLDHRQRYLEDTNVLVTTAQHAGLQIEVTDFVHPVHDVLVRQAELRNHAATPTTLAFAHMDAASLEENRDLFGYNLAYYDSRVDCLVRFRGHPFDSSMEGHVVLLAAAVPSQDAFQCGVAYEREGDRIDAYVDLSDGDLQGNDYASDETRGVTTGLLWKLTVPPGEMRTLTVLFAGGPTLDAAERLLRTVRAIPAEQLLAETVAYWKEWLAPGAAWSTRIGDPRLRSLYRRSLLVNKLLQDANYGAIIAAPAVAPDYRYCWVRDGAFVAWALGTAGYHAEAAAFYRWCARTQTANGLWCQNHYTDGRRHWPGIQVDQVGTAIWGMHQHYLHTGDRHFLSELWPTVRRAAEYILSRTDTANGLVYSEQDLWEESGGHLTYTNAACQAGLRAAADIAHEVGASSTGDVYRQAAGRLRARIQQHLVQEGAYVGALEPHRAFRVRADYVVDVSIVGLAVPFGVVDARSPALVRAVEWIEGACEYPVRGVGRYASDLFMGGNPWPLSALWLSLYYVHAGQWPPPREHLEWCLAHTTPHGFIAEQQDKRTGAPVSAMPLAWAHAWFTALMHALVARGVWRTPTPDPASESSRLTGTPPP